MPVTLQIAEASSSGHPTRVDLVDRLAALERALIRMGVRFREEELPDEAAIDGGLCKVDNRVVLYVSPSAPPWRRAEVLLGALRRLPHDDVWLPPEIRVLVSNDGTGGEPECLVRYKDRHEL